MSPNVVITSSYVENVQCYIEMFFVTKDAEGPEGLDSTRPSAPSNSKSKVWASKF